jgi:L-ascorbate metabolism protein UlaG (beta-lactamase superfamily)
VDALEVTFVPAHHWSRRGLFDHCASLWGGFVLTLPGDLRVYHAGDSAYGPFFASIGARYPGSTSRCCLLARRSWVATD